jgi:BirA family biotin operon repressor/biotin-[acetyl-CoA-carboxylase] ligase
MDFSLGPRARAAGYRLAAYDTIGSTSSEALARARAGDAGKLWIVARAQTAGHGRRGRGWETPRGNLAASLLMPVMGQAEPATLGFAAGLALDDAIRAVAPEIGVKVALDDAAAARDRIRLKWPNDVLVDGAKVAGILLEAASSGGGASAVVIGIGVNVAAAPRDVPYPATSLAVCGSTVAAEALFAALAEAWVAQAELWASARGFAALRDRWLARAAGLGNPIAVNMGGTVFRGTFETIDETGRLVVRGAEGVAHVISAGDVHFGVAATAER